MSAAKVGTTSATHLSFPRVPMGTLVEVLEKRRIECAEIFARLLSATPYDMDGPLLPRVPVSSGLYVIARKSDTVGKYLWAGKTKNLKRRICVDHCAGGGDRATSDLIQKVIDKGEAQSRKEAQSWIRAKCVVQWVVVEDTDLRGWAEHYILSVVQPIWGS